MVSKFIFRYSCRMSVKSLNFTQSATKNSFQYLFKYFIRPWRNVEISLWSTKHNFLYKQENGYLFLKLALVMANISIFQTYWLII